MTTSEKQTEYQGLTDHPKERSARLDRLRAMSKAVTKTTTPPPTIN